jgi:hypothetical protein
MTETKLLPCPVPWCPKNRAVSLVKMSAKVGWVMCPACGCQTTAISYEKAVATWNTRIDPVRDALAKALEGMLRFVDVCEHTNNHREGSIWTKCDDCGKRFADDEGGINPDQEPKELTAALAALKLHKEEK